MHSNVCEPEAFTFDMINTIISGFQMPDLKIMTSIKGLKDEMVGVGEDQSSARIVSQN